MIRSFCMVALAALGTACADHAIEVGPDLNSLQKRSERDALDELCDGSALEGGGVWACILDSAGHSWEVDGTLYVLPTRPPYGVSFQFEPPITVTPAELSTEGPDAAIRVYAAPYNTEGSPSTPDGDESKRIAARAMVGTNGGVLVLIEDELPSGTQVAVLLDYAALPALARVGCDSYGPCVPLQYWARFYVGAEPPLAFVPTAGKARQPLHDAPPVSADEVRAYGI